MQPLFKKSCFLISVFLCFNLFPAKATHIVGGDITVQALGGNDFQITLTLFFDCINGNFGAFDPIAQVGIYNKANNALQQVAIIPFVDSLTLQLGDTCYIPPNLCVRKQRYISTVSIPDNPSGYYLCWIRCCRNGIISNIVDPGASGNVFYAEIPDPALANSSPTFSSYPDAYMCATVANVDSFAATDVDGDSLAYSFITPLDCNTNGLCSAIPPPGPNPGPGPGPYGTVVWKAPYSSSNIMGDPTQAINPQTGIITTTPTIQDVFVFCVRVQEYRGGIKIGEIRREVQYAVLPCKVPTITVIGPTPICLGESITLAASGAQSYLWNTGETSTFIAVSPTAAGTYTYTASASLGPTCTAYASTTIAVIPNPIAGVSCSDLCAGESVLLTASGGNTYWWSNGATSSSITLSPITPVTVTVIANLNGCYDTAMCTINIFPAPTAMFDTVSIGENHESYLFTDMSIGAVAWFWDFGDGSTSTEQNSVHTYANAGTYIVTEVVTNQYGCSDTTVMEVSVSIYFTFYIPNCFTPNSDGHNSFFYGKGIGIQEYKMWIFDRWGNLIWNCETMGLPQLASSCWWDGKVEKGASKKLVQEDVYVWKVNIIDIFNRQLNYVGYVSVIK